MDNLSKDIQVCQQAIVSHILDTDPIFHKPYYSVLDSKMLGPYALLYDWVRDNGNEKTTEFHAFITKNGLTEKYYECTAVEWFTTNLGAEIERLLRYYYFDSRPSSKILDHLEEYNQKRDELAIVRSNTDAKKYSGIEIWSETHEDICEMHLARSEGAEPIVNDKYGIPSLDEITDWFRRGTVTRVNGYSNVGKSKFTYMIGNSFLRRKKRVMYVTLEVPKKMLMMNLMANWSRVPMRDIERGRTVPDMSGYRFDLLEIVDDKHEWSTISEYIDKRRPDLIIIDFVQNIQVKGMPDLFQKMEYLASQIQLLAIKTNCMIMDVSQVANDKAKYRKGDTIPSKGSGALVASADIALVLVDNGESNNFISLFVAKNKFGVKDIEIALTPRFNINDFEDLGEIGGNGPMLKENI